MIEWNLILFWINLPVTRVLLIVLLQLIKMWLNVNAIHLDYALLCLLVIAIEQYNIILLSYSHQPPLYCIAIDTNLSVIFLCIYYLITRILSIILSQLSETCANIDAIRLNSALILEYYSIILPPRELIFNLTLNSVNSVNSQKLYGIDISITTILN